MVHKAGSGGCSDNEKTENKHCGKLLAKNLKGVIL